MLSARKKTQTITTDDFGSDKTHRHLESIKLSFISQQASHKAPAIIKRNWKLKLTDKTGNDKGFSATSHACGQS